MNKNLIFIAEINNCIKQLDEKVYTVSELKQSTHAMSEAAKDLKSLSLTLEQTLDNTRSWINEPSGITNSNLEGSAEAKGPFAVAVDDEEPETTNSSLLATSWLAISTRIPW